jgi:hypothetical protein
LVKLLLCRVFFHSVNKSNLATVFCAREKNNFFHCYPSISFLLSTYNNDTQVVLER